MERPIDEVPAPEANLLAAAASAAAGCTSAASGGSDSDELTPNDDESPAGPASETQAAGIAGGAGVAAELARLRDLGRQALAASQPLADSGGPAGSSDTSSPAALPKLSSVDRYYSSLAGQAAVTTVK